MLGVAAFGARNFKPELRPSRDQTMLACREVTSLKTLALVSVLWMGVPRVAEAQEWTRQSFLLPKGGFELTGTPARPELMRINSSKNSAFKPVEFPIHLFWGISNDVMIGITHDRGLRLNTGDLGPNDRKVYNDVGFGSVINLARQRNYEVDLHLGVPFHQLRPDLLVGVQFGVLGRANFAETVAFVYDPSVYIGANRRSFGNGDYLNVPIWFYFQATPSIAPFVGTGLEGPVDRFGDFFRIPIEGGVLFTVAHGIHIGGMLRFHNALGRFSTLDSSELGFLGQFRF